ncbi:hypothetical protein C8R43DRAFT_941128 [Mycena crocata]|nr:hypothetical protein C8R43DRAFT_941128 [Mycena crocata]
MYLINHTFKSLSVGVEKQHEKWKRAGEEYESVCLTLELELAGGVIFLIGEPKREWNQRRLQEGHRMNEERELGGQNDLRVVRAEFLFERRKTGVTNWAEMWEMRLGGAFEAQSDACHTFRSLGISANASAKRQNTGAKASKAETLANEENNNSNSPQSCEEARAVAPTAEEAEADGSCRAYPSGFKARAKTSIKRASEQGEEKAGGRREFGEREDVEREGQALTDSDDKKLDVNGAGVPWAFLSTSSDTTRTGKTRL